MSGKTLRWLAVLLFLVAVLMALRLIGPKVPNEIRMLSGPEGTTYHDDALRYQEFLGRHGVTVHLEQTSGSVENLNSCQLPSQTFGAIHCSHVLEHLSNPRGFLNQ